MARASFPSFCFVFYKEYEMDRFVKHRSRTAEFLEGNHGFIELFIFVDHHLLAGPFTNDQTRITPPKVIHAPEGIYGQQEAVDRIPIMESQYYMYRLFLR